MLARISALRAAAAPRLASAFARPTALLLSQSLTSKLKLAQPLTRSYYPQQPPPQAFPAPPQQPPPGYAKKTRNRVFLATAALILMLYAGWKYITFHRYPATVADKLRKGLYEEYQENYAEALKYFLEALEELDQMHEDSMQSPKDSKKLPAGTLPKHAQLDNDLFYISDEYTGLQIKIAETYDKLGLTEDAVHMYREIETVYLHALRANIVPPQKRLDIIKRDLAVTLISAYGMPSTGNLQPAILSLAVHFSMAQNELARLHPELAPLFDEERLRIGPSTADPSKPVSSDNMSLRAESGSGRQTGNARRVRVKIALDVSDTQAAIEAREKAAKLWEPFRDELFAARQLFAILSMASKDYPTAIESTFNTTKWMVAAGYPLDEILVSFYTSGTYLYLQAEEIELQNYLAEQRKKNQKTEDIPIKDFTPEEFRERFTKELETPFLPTPPPESIGRESLENAATIFSTVLNTIKNLPSGVRRKGSIDEVHAMAMYSLGVVNLHKGDLDKAQELLREARLRAKGCGYDVLADHADMELATVDDLRKYKESGNDEQYLNGLYSRVGSRGSTIDFKMVPLPENSALSLSELSKS